MGFVMFFSCCRVHWSLSAKELPPSPCPCSNTVLQRECLKEACLSSTLLLLSCCTAGASLKRPIQMLPYWHWLLRLGFYLGFVKRSSCLSFSAEVFFPVPFAVLLLAEGRREGGLEWSKLCKICECGWTSFLRREGERSGKAKASLYWQFPIFPSLRHILSLIWLGITVTSAAKDLYSPKLPKLD